MAEAPPPESAEPKPDYGQIHIGEEMDKAKWTLPPMRIVGVGLVVLLIAVAAVSWFNRYQPGAAGSMGQVFAVEQSDHSGVLVTVQITVRNSGNKPLFIRNLKGELKADGKTLPDDPASAVDYERYFQAYPELRGHATAALLPETRIAPGTEARGTLIFGFAVGKDAFDKRESLSVTVEPYDQRPIVIADKGPK